MSEASRMGRRDGGGVVGRPAPRDGLGTEWLRLGDRLDDAGSQR